MGEGEGMGVGSGVGVGAGWGFIRMGGSAAAVTLPPTFSGIDLRAHTRSSA